MSQLNVDTIKKADGTGNLTIPATTGTLLTTAGGVLTGDLTLENNGLYLGGTGAANYLDDYEEGTWTPDIGGLTTNPSRTANSGNAGFYTKIGRMVLAGFNLDYGSISGGGGAFLLTGLPFPIKSDAEYRTSGNVSFFRGVAHSGSRLAPHSRASYSQCLFYREANTTEFDVSVNISDLSSSVTMHGHFIYMID